MCKSHVLHYLRSIQLDSCIKDSYRRSVDEASTNNQLNFATMARSTVILSVLAACLVHLAHAHSRMAKPYGLSGKTCKMGGELRFGRTYCRGPCDLSSLKIGRAEYNQIRRGVDVFENRSKKPRTKFYPPNKPAEVYRRGQIVRMVYTRNNHGPGGFERYALIPLSYDWMNKAVHTRLTFRYSCWGENPQIAQPNEMGRDEFGFSLVGTDGDNHRFAKGYYVNKVEIPDVVPDGKYIIAWAWFGGCGCRVTSSKAVESCGTSYFSDYWSCSFIEIKGGKPLAKEYKPVFIGSNFAKPRGSACRAAFDSLGQCKFEPCRGKQCRYMKPRAFLGDGPRPLTPADFGYKGPVGRVKSKVGKKLKRARSPSRKPAPSKKLKPKKSKPDPKIRPGKVMRRSLFSCLCIAYSRRCYSYFQKNSSGCNRHTFYKHQPDSCRKSCCSVCKHHRNWDLCKYYRVKEVCKY